MNLAMDLLGGEDQEIWLEEIGEQRILFRDNHRHRIEEIDRIDDELGLPQLVDDVYLPPELLEQSDEYLDQRIASHNIVGGTRYALYKSYARGLKHKEYDYWRNMWEQVDSLSREELDILDEYYGF